MSMPTDKLTGPVPQTHDQVGRGRVSVLLTWVALAATAVLMFFLYRAAGLKPSLAGLLALCGGSASF